MTIGVDVSQATLEWCALTGQPATLPNEPAAIGTWLTTLPAGTTIAMEATGRYHRPLADLAVARGYRVLVLNPHDVHHYAQSLTPRATTDPIMAQVIAQYAASAPRLHAYQPSAALVDEVQSLVRLRLGLVQEHVRLGHQRRAAPGLAEFLDPMRTAVRQQIHTVSAQITHRVQTRAAFADLHSVPGFGALTAAYLLILLTRHTFVSSDAFVAFLGWDLRVKDSGKKRGQRVLTKRGDPEARRLLFLAARAASRREGPFRTLYERAQGAGWSKTEATVIVARKLARLAWSIATHGTKYDPARVLTQA